MSDQNPTALPPHQFPQSAIDRVANLKRQRALEDNPIAALISIVDENFAREPEDERERR
jgi:hypothetical protein